MERMGIPEEIFNSQKYALEILDTIKYDDGDNKLFCDVYFWNYKGDISDFVPQKEEVDHIEVWSFDKIRSEI